MCYEDRLRQYEEEKRRLQSKNLSDEEYMRAIIKLANKWRV
jgi:lipase chaperone LimK